MNDFDSVNPKLISAAETVQNQVVARLSKICKLPENKILEFLNNKTFEISTDFFNDLSYEVQRSGFLLLSLIAVVLNRVMSSEQENEQNDKDAALWLTSAIGSMKYSEDRDIINAALDVVKFELEQSEQETPMDCVRVIDGKNRVTDSEFWEDVIWRADSLEHIRNLTEEHEPYTDAYKVVIDGIESVYFVELPKWQGSPKFAL